MQQILSELIYYKHVVINFSLGHDIGIVTKRDFQVLQGNVSGKC